MHQHVVELLDQDPSQHAVLCFRQPAIIEEWCERPYETHTQRDGAVCARTDFGCVEDEQRIEPTLLLAERAGERLDPIKRAIEGALLFTQRATVCRTDDQGAIRRRRQIVRTEQGRLCRKHGAAYSSTRFWPLPNADLATR